MRCPSCGNGELLNSVTTYFVTRDSGYVIIENVPCKKCPYCGEEYFPPSVMERIDYILESVRDIESKIFIMDYREAA